MRVDPFTPPTDSLPGILADMRRPDLSFTDLAARHDTTPDALALWLATADIAHIVETTDAMVCYRTRLIAADHASLALTACIRILEAFNKAAAKWATAPNAEPAPESSDEERFQYRAIESARKAAAIVLRLTRLARTPGPTWVPRQPISAQPSPQADADPPAQPPRQTHAIELKHAHERAQPHPAHNHAHEREHEHVSQPRASAFKSEVSVSKSEIPGPASRPLPFPAKQLWRNTPGAATARAP